MLTKEDKPRELFKEKMGAVLGSGVSFPKDTISLLRGFVIYVYLKNNEPIYIGRSLRGILRAIDHRHTKALEEFDELIVFQTKDHEDSVKAEKLLIKEFKPYLNTQGVFDYLGRPVQ